MELVKYKEKYLVSSNGDVYEIKETYTKKRSNQ